MLTPEMIAQYNKAFGNENPEKLLNIVTFGRGGDYYHLAYRIQEWPPAWGNSLEIYIYGDFNAPDSEVQIESLGITIYPEKIEDTHVKSAMYVLRARVEVKEKTVSELADAAHRINILLGMWSLLEWGSADKGWWSWVTHGRQVYGGASKIDHKDLHVPIESLLKLPEPVKRKVEAALYWIREPGSLLQEWHRSDVLRLYASCWNAFECLVEAVNILRPQQKLSKEKKQQLIDEFVAQRGGKLTAQDIQDCYRQFVDPGFSAKARHALIVCFPKEADTYFLECFKAPDKLYQIRNDINHGNVDAEDPNELLRITTRLQLLSKIVLRMFSRLIPFAAPAP